ncbi:hypothetical protein LSH36_580g00024 [Paralvinella palmiformis]|uniref:DUF7789 domain-containing protein n=1 Tax=Paralvinella palmiformis TaxID=53620 RepID=A0AAD9J5L9_9ANNE|nr:hypothetical protein LSH36_580g00024 [Paralvinella palmiformis]
MMESDSTDIVDIRYTLPVRNQTTTDQIFGKRKSFAGLLVVEWLFLITSFINISACLAMSLYRLIVLNSVQIDSPDFTLTILIVINCLFCAFYVVHGILREKEFELYVYIGAILFILTYCVLEYAINVFGHTPIKLARLVIISVLAPFNIILAVLVAREFGWLEFKIVGASEVLQSMYRDASRYTSLLLFDLQVMITFVLLVLNNGIQVTLAEIITVSVGIPLSVIWCILGWLSMRNELYWGMVMFFVTGLGSPAYVFYVIYKVSGVLITVVIEIRFKFYLVVSSQVNTTELKNVLLYGSMAAAFEVEASETTNLLAVPRRR